MNRVAAFPRQSPWAWPVTMLLIGVLATAAALIVTPGPDEWSYVLGQRLGDDCGFYVTTGQPCPSCGMTRSWTWLARGAVLKAFSYNAAGAILLISLWVMGLLGAVRLVTRNPKKWQIPFGWLSAGVMVWMILPYLSLWFARMAGLYPLAMPS